MFGVVLLKCRPHQISPISLSLSHCHLLSELSIPYQNFHVHCSLEIKNIIPDLLRHVRSTRNSTQSDPSQAMLPNPPTVSTNRHSFQELVNFVTPYLPLPCLNSTTYPASNQTLTNLILSPYLHNSPFFLHLGIAIDFMAFPNITY